jgi:hypothetical protein
MRACHGELKVATTFIACVTSMHSTFIIDIHGTGRKRLQAHRDFFN